MDILIAFYKIEFTVFIISLKLYHLLTGQVPPGLYLWHHLVGTGTWNWSNTLTLTPGVVDSLLYLPQKLCVLYQ